MFPALTGREVASLLKKTGFSVERQKGSHVFMRHIDWMIVGGESGPGARPMEPEWVLDIRDQCKIAGSPFFFKQWGGTRKKKAGRMLEGRTWDEMPVMARRDIRAMVGRE
ncbi:MAG TPA: DUF5131 family protein [Thermodesulfovibrionales bacterium]|nr:DUF5131 family protein [Thermodesulfovibrionales bacterium]